MNRTGLIALAVASSIAGGIVWNQLGDGDVANAAPRTATITRDGSSAKVRSLTLQVVDLSDGGLQYLAHPAGSFSESETLADGGTEVTVREASAPAPCILASGSQAEARAAAVVADALVCFRSGKRLER